MSIRHDTTVTRSSLWNNDHVGNLDDLDDVDAPTPADGDVLTYVDSSGNWEAVAASGGSGSGGGQIIMSEYFSDPPEPVWTEDGFDYVYAE
jgi:hypothetical protein